MSLLLFINAEDKREGDGKVTSGAMLSPQDDAAEGPWSGISRVLGRGGWEGEAQVGESRKGAASRLQ